ncbi:MAG: dTDP-4-dehydrorhamnose reductase [Candidatus Margulisiibacteriota bacterium]
MTTVPFLITGAGGMLAKAFRTLLPASQVIAADSKTLDVTDAVAIEKALDAGPLRAVIHCAAYTQVDACETNIEKALLVNGTAVGHLALACAKRGIPLVHFSTDYVFDGEKPSAYVEDDVCSPINRYGESKWAGEQALQAVAQHHPNWPYFIFRIQWLYGAGGVHFVDTIARLAKEKGALSVVRDQWGSPSWTLDIAASVLSFLQRPGPRGIYHLANQGYTTWYDLTVMVLAELGIPCQLTPVDSSAFPRPAKRPHQSSLSIGRFLGTGAKPPLHWRDAVQLFLKSNR